MENKSVEGMLRLISAYSENGIANFKQKDLDCYCCGNTAYAYIKDLEKENKIEKISEEGYYPRYKVNEVLDCPNFIIDTKLSIFNKTFLLNLMETFKEDLYKERTNKSLEKELEISGIKRRLEAIKNTSSKEWYEILNEMTFIKLKLDTEHLVNTDKGYMYVYKNKNLEETIKSKVNSTVVANKYRDKLIVENPAEYLFKQFIKASRVRQNIKEFELTIEDIQKLLDTQQNRCHYTNIEFTIEDGYRPSLDRIDSSKGYTKDNVVICLGRVNIMKNIFEYNEFIELCNAIANTHPIYK